jgi:hypothetical protein
MQFSSEFFFSGEGLEDEEAENGDGEQLEIESSGEEDMDQ